MVTVTLMKYILSILFVIFLAGCGLPAVKTAGQIGSAVQQCCERIQFAKENSPIRFRSPEGGGGQAEAPFFEPQIQLVHTW